MTRLVEANQQLKAERDAAQQELADQLAERDEWRVRYNTSQRELAELHVHWNALTDAHREQSETMVDLRIRAERVEQELAHLKDILAHRTNDEGAIRDENLRLGRELAEVCAKLSNWAVAARVLQEQRDEALARAERAEVGLVDMQRHRDAWRGYAYGKRERPRDFLDGNMVPEDRGDTVADQLTTAQARVRELEGALLSIDLVCKLWAVLEP
jgi:chromosome segregation ATPase